MGRPKSSKAKIYHARLNPINPHEGRAMELIEEWEQKGVNFKQLAVDRILRCEGYTPELFDTEIAKAPSIDVGELVGQMQTLLEQFAAEIVSHIQKGHKSGASPIEDEDDGEQVSRFSRNFVNGFIQRQQQGRGNDDDE